MFTNLTQLLLAVIHSLLITTCSSRATKLIGIQVMEMGDLSLLEASPKVGNLAYGDSCHNKGVSTIIEDVCFHSNPLFQCLDGRCNCGYIQLPDGERAEQMVYENGRCKRPLGFQCISNEDCLSGTVCTQGQRSSGNNPQQSGEEDFIEDDRLTTFNLQRKRIKAYIKTLAGQRNASLVSTTLKPAILEALPDPGVENDENEVQSEPDAASKMDKNSIISSSDLNGKSTICMKAGSVTIVHSSNYLWLCGALLCIYYSVHSVLFIKNIDTLY